MWTAEQLTNPSAQMLGQKKILPLSRFCDEDIHAMDFGSWKATESQYEWNREEQEKMARLREEIERDGLRTKIEIWCRDGDLAVFNGHHRVVLLKQMGWTHVPYRWFVPERRPFRPQRYRRDHLPGPPSSR